MKDNQLFNGSLIFFLVIMAGLALAAITKSQKGYEQSNGAVHQSLQEQDYLVKYSEYLKKSNDPDYDITPVDLRDPRNYQQGHLSNSLNLPVSEIFKKENLKKLKRMDTELLLYSGSEANTLSTLLMLRSLGLENLHVLSGSYKTIQRHIIEANDHAWYFYSDQKIKWNYPHFIKPQEEDPSEPGPKPEQPQVQGGC
ncbi:MAG: rhodanese-like domain-containing protein [Bacteroidales bacterium]